MSQFKIYSSSAGSGKTYTLTKEFLKLALMDDPTKGKFNAYYFKHILAVTFTNDAASEMKERILKELRYIAERPLDVSLKQPLFVELLQYLGLAAQPLELRNRAKAVFHAIIHDYSDFAVSTIDSFVRRIVSAFAEELGFSFNFDVNLESTQLLETGVEKMLAKAGTEEFAAMTEAIKAFVLEKAADGSNWNHMGSELATFGRVILEEQNHDILTSLYQLETADFLAIRSQIDKYFQQLEAQVMADVQAGIACLESAGVGPEDLPGGKRGIWSFFHQWNNKKFSEVFLTDNITYSKASQTLVESGDWLKKAKGPMVAAIASIQAQLEACYLRIIDTFEQEQARYALYQAISPYLFKLSLLSQIKAEVEAIQRDSNSVHISNFGVRILDIVLQEPVPFIYERIGERYHHILIDEFQDTSTIQWNNFLPLVSNSLGYGYFNLLVGDGKQAIYGWRGGEMEQIVTLHNLPQAYGKLPNLFPSQLDPDQQDNLTERYQALLLHHRPENLTTNWRSRKEIIEFNNSFFEEIVLLHRHDKPLLAQTYQAFEQAAPPHAQTGGHVQIDFVADVEVQDGLNPVHERILALVQEALAEGFALRDIAILSRKNQDSSQIAKFLQEHGYAITSSDSLLLHFSEAVNLVMALLNVIHNPENKLATYEALYLFYRIIKAEIPDNQTNERIQKVVEQSSNDALYAHLAQQGYVLDAFKLQQSGVYEITEKLIVTFRLFERSQENDFLFRLLDIVLEFNTKQSGHLADFLTYWEQNKHRFSIQSPANQDAITIISIHRSKGLQYPVVIVPYANWHLSPRPEWQQWLSLESIDYQELRLDTRLGHAARLSVSVFKKAQAQLLPTALSKQFDERITKAFVENTNLLYVALTRPEQRLYVIVRMNKATEPNFRGSVGFLFYDYIQKKGLWQDTQSSYVIHQGLPKPSSSTPEPEPNTFVIRHIISHDRSNNMRLRRLAERMFDVETFEKSKDWGNKVHAILAKIKSETDVPAALADALLEGLIDGTEAAELQSSLERIMQLPSLKPLFSKGLRIENEREILTATKRFRPDRVVFLPDRVVVVDYKTGTPQDEHAAQVRRYVSLYLQMGHAQVEGLLVYLDRSHTQVVAC